MQPIKPTIETIPVITYFSKLSFVLGFSIFSFKTLNLVVASPSLNTTFKVCSPTLKLFIYSLLNVIIVLPSLEV